MNFKGNVFSLGEGELVSAAQTKNGDCQCFIKNSGVTARRTFNANNRALKTSERAASYADWIWAIMDGAAELSGGRLDFEIREM
ncbi:MAG: hypothetical protein FWD86_00415 [Firmicutes bacterium]|nr:hypothetical protein [Bacillota bacterium]